jgi:hypothetical protein
VYHRQGSSNSLADSNKEYEIRQWLKSLSNAEEYIQNVLPSFTIIEQRNILFKELNLRGKLTAKEVFKILGISDKEFKLNFTEIEGGFSAIAKTNVPKTDFVCQSKIMNA